jgi:hypothetical protein
MRSPLPLAHTPYAPPPLLPSAAAPQLTFSPTHALTNALTHALNHSHSHEPRFSIYSSFFAALTNVSDVLLSAEIPTPQIIKPLSGGDVGDASALSDANGGNDDDDGGGSIALKLDATTCYQYQDPSQAWTLSSFPGPGVRRLLLTPLLAPPGTTTTTKTAAS